MKRSFDLAVAVLLLLLASPLLLVIALSIRMAMGSPVLFRQVRPGMGGHPFTLLKFRTMQMPASAGALDDDARRLTLFGSFLRRASLDELPELLNVIRGEMSLIGPRPLLMEYLPLYNSVQSRRHEVRPGITGWAQVNGRNAISWEQKFEYDVWYVDHQSFLLDLRILLSTISGVFGSKGISHPGHVTMERFRGTKT